MLPIKVNTWGQSSKSDGTVADIYIADYLNNQNRRDAFAIFEYTNNKTTVFDTLYTDFYSLECHFYRNYSNISWEENILTKIQKIQPNKKGWILSECEFNNYQIIISNCEIDDSEKQALGIGVTTKGWIIETSSDGTNYEILDITYNIEMISYLLARHNIEITYPPDFDIDSISGIWEALTYWRLQTTHPAYSKQIAELNLKLMNFLTQSHHSQDRQTINIILQAWHTQPQSEQKLSNIARYEKRLAQCLVIEPIQNKITALETLRQSRPLLAREQVELEILQGILAAQTEAEIDTIISQIKATPTDAELRKILTAQAEARRSLIINNNI